MLILLLKSLNPHILSYTIYAPLSMPCGDATEIVDELIG